MLAWHDHFDNSIDTLQARVDLGVQDPLPCYSPFIQRRRLLISQLSQDKLADTLLIYRHWSNRSLHRAKNYFLTAILFTEQMGDLDHAAAILRRGMDAGAQLSSLLEHLLENLNERS